MAEARLRFGAQSSADVKLFLTGPDATGLDEEKYKGNPVYLHSHILKRLKCFESRFFSRWSSDKPTEIRVTISHNFDHYLKCIEIMYGEHVDFPNIMECLEILSVASEMLADDCINKCMQYLEAVRWSAKEESEIRNVLSREELKVSPDLAARLHQDDDNHITFVEKIVQEMVSLIKSNSSGLSKSQETVGKDLAGMLDGNRSKDVVDVCGRVLLQEFKAAIDSRNFTTLTLFFKLIKHCNGGILEAALKAFCEDAEFIKYVKQNSRAVACQTLLIADFVFCIIMWFMKAAGEGKVIISRASRVSFLTTWLPIMGKFIEYSTLPDKFAKLDKAVLNVVESLPQGDQKRICVVWAEIYRLHTIDITTPYVLAKNLLFVPSVLCD